MAPRNQKPINIDEIGGKVPPNSAELEKAVLGAIMLTADAIVQIGGTITKDTFYQEKHKVIYDAAERIWNKGINIDIVSVSEELETMGKIEQAGGLHYLSELTLAVTSTASLSYWCAILNEHYVKRRFIDIAADALNKVYSERELDIFDEISNTEAKIMKITSSVLRKHTISASDVSKKVIEQLKQPNDRIIGIPSGLVSLDMILGGFMKTNFIIIAARPSVGKSVLAANFAAFSSIRQGVPTALFSLEMSSEEFLTRIYSSETAITGHKLKTRSLDSVDWDRIYQFKTKLDDAPLFLDDTPSISIMELRSKCIRLKQKENIGMIIIDYLQLMKGNGKYSNREAEVSDISRSLKSLAKELEIPIIALAQLSRAVEQRADKRPILSDLRESGSIEMDADIVMFLTRPSLYEMDSVVINGQQYSTENFGILDIAKHRNGTLGMIPLRFYGALSKFTDINSPGPNFTPLNEAEDIF
jgi:replicative DNA helicase